MKNLVGPGIAQAEYGGAMFLFPPRPIPDIWDDPRLDFADTLEERLLAGAFLHSRERHVAVVCPKPPLGLLATPGPAVRQEDRPPPARPVRRPARRAAPAVPRPQRQAGPLLRRRLHPGPLTLAKPFDATTRRLLEIDPAGWLACVGLPMTGPVRAVDSDVSTVTAEADTILQVGEPADYLAHIELQSGHDLTLPRRLLHYNVLLNYRHDRPVRSVADPAPARRPTARSLTGTSPGLAARRLKLPRLPLFGHAGLDAGRGTVLRERPGDASPGPAGGGRPKNGPPGRHRSDEADGSIRRFPKNEANLLWAATKILMGLKYSDEISRNASSRESRG